MNMCVNKGQWAEMMSPRDDSLAPPTIHRVRGRSHILARISLVCLALSSNTHVHKMAAAAAPDSFSECEYYLGETMLHFMERNIAWGDEFMGALVRKNLMCIKTRKICKTLMSAECTRVFVKEHLIPSCSRHGFKSSEYYHFIEALLETRQVLVAERLVNDMNTESKVRRVMKRKLIGHEQTAMVKEECWLAKQKFSRERAQQEVDQYWFGCRSQFLTDFNLAWAECWENSPPSINIPPLKCEINIVAMVRAVINTNHEVITDHLENLLTKAEERNTLIEDSGLLSDWECETPSSVIASTMVESMLLGEPEEYLPAMINCCDAIPYLHHLFSTLARVATSM